LRSAVALTLHGRFSEARDQRAVVWFNACTGEYEVNAPELPGHEQGAPMVVYVSLLQLTVWVRPEAMWREPVRWPDGNMRPRFDPCPELEQEGTFRHGLDRAGAALVLHGFVFAERNHIERPLGPMIKIREQTDPTSCLNKAERDEPVFVLLARDPQAAALVRKWADDRERESALAGKPERPEKLAEARALADLMDAWRSEGRARTA